MNIEDFVHKLNELFCLNDKAKEDEYLEIVKRYVKELLRHVHNFYVESILCPL